MISKPATMLTVDQTAEYLQCSTDLVRRQIKNGTLPYLKLGRVYRVPLYALEEKIRLLNSKATEKYTPDDLRE